MFDAYTVKKVVPRLIAAVILIQLSWFLFTGLIVVINNIAYGIEALIYAPFGGPAKLTLSEILSQMQGGGNGLGAFTAIAAGLAAGGFALAAGGVLATAGIALLGVLIAFALLLFRQVAIVALLIISPLALVAWILPGTEKWWKMWWDSFFKLLLVYPIILGLLATGRVLALVVVETDPGSGTFSAIDDVLTFFFVIACVFGPFYLIPKTFQLAGGVFQTLTGTINNKSKGAFDRMRNSRQKTQAKNLADFKAGSRFSERNAFTRRVNRVGAGIGVGSKGLYGFGERGNQALDLSSQNAAEEALKNNPNLQKLAFNDEGNAVMALSGGSRAGAEAAARDLFTDAAGNYDQARADRALAAASAVGFSRANAQAAMTTLAQNKSRAVAADAEGRQQVQRGINRLLSGDSTGATAGNDQQADSLRSSFAYHSSGAGRGDLGGTSWDSATASLDGFERTGLYQASMGHQNGIIGARQDALALAATGNPDDMRRAAQHRMELESMLSSATGPVRDEVLRSIDELDTTGGVGAWLQQDTGAVYPPGHPQAGRPVMVDQRTTYDPTNPAHASWSATDQARGWRNEPRQQRNRDVIRSRTVQRPDPSEL